MEFPIFTLRHSLLTKYKSSPAPQTVVLWAKKPHFGCTLWHSVNAKNKKKLDFVSHPAPKEGLNFQQPSKSLFTLNFCHFSQKYATNTHISNSNNTKTSSKIHNFDHQDQNSYTSVKRLKFLPLEGYVFEIWKDMLHTKSTTVQVYLPSTTEMVWKPRIKSSRIHLVRLSDAGGICGRMGRVTPTHWVPHRSGTITPRNTL